MSSTVGRALDFDLMRAEFPRASDGSVYLNTGSNGRKPVCVLREINEGWARLNQNPTHWTFFAEEVWEDARRAAAKLFDVNADSLLLTQNATQGIQMVLQSFLLKPGDELVTTTHEHGSLRTVARYLAETRGIVVREFDVDPLSGSDSLCTGLMSLVNEKTRLVYASEVFCYAGWRPNLAPLVDALEAVDVPLLVDGAHTAGQGVARPARYPMWVTSGHKWLGAPNGTGLLYVQDRYVDRLQPTVLGDRFYNEHPVALRKFEFPGTCDVVRWMGFAKAIELYGRFGEDAVSARQEELVQYLRERLSELPNANIRTPDVANERTAMLTVTWEQSQLHVPNLKSFLWASARLYTQSDYRYGAEGNGLRISCHYAIEHHDIDRLIDALKPALNS